MVVARNRIFCLMLLCSIVSLRAMNAPDSVGLPPEVGIELSRRNIAIDNANIHNHEDASVHHHHYDIHQNPEPNTINACLQQGFYRGIQGVATELTTQTILGIINASASLAVNKLTNSENEIDQKTFAKINQLTTKIQGLTLLYNLTEDKKTAKGYEELIKKYKAEIENILKEYLVSMKAPIQEEKLKQ